MHVLPSAQEAFSPPFFIACSALSSLRRVDVYSFDPESQGTWSYNHSLVGEIGSRRP